MICTAANALWLAGCLGEAARFRSALRRVRSEQERLLRKLLCANEASDFGRRHGFAAIASPREYQSRVPIRSYDDYQRAIGRIAAGAKHLLTREQVRLLEPTSGSASATKLIPYTRSLQREFQRGIQPWIADLFVRHPDLMRGQAYWSVSPAPRIDARTPGGLPIGFDDDAAYVGGWRRALVEAVMAVPASLRGVPDIDSFQYQTLLALVRSRDLRLISIWNPTFLSLILEKLPACADSLLRDLHATPHHTRILRAALDATSASERHTILWPRLGLISCWGDATATGAAAQLAQMFPQARIQPKGLIATEAFVSLPLIGQQAAALSIRSHFFEFAPVGSDGHADEASPLMAHELERGRQYTVVISTGGGLYRYRLDDIIEVAGHLGACPLIRFVGRHAHVSDWFGEKLHEAHVAGVLRDAFAAPGSAVAPAFGPAFAPSGSAVAPAFAPSRSAVVPAFRPAFAASGSAVVPAFRPAFAPCGSAVAPAFAPSGSAVAPAFAPSGSAVAPAFRPAFAMLACDRELAPAAYVLYVDSDADDTTLSAAAAAVDDGLRGNFHYDYARLLGQLGHVRVFRAEHAARTYLEAAVAAGQRAGDVKAPALDRRDGWSRRFRGRLIPTPSRSTPSGSAPLRRSR